MHVIPVIRRIGLWWLVLICVFSARAQHGNALSYLDGADPFYVGVDFPKLTTPQWVGEAGVDAVVIIAIDDMRESGRFETFLRPVIERLKAIDGRAPVSIMSNELDPSDPHFQIWLDEGLSIDVHTLSHPCPLLQKGDFNGAAADYHGSIDLLAQIEGNTPVAYRMPCCDSINSSSPRFYTEIFNQPTDGGRYLSIDSSVAQIFTDADPELPIELTRDADGRERFRKYLPFPAFKTTIENYPYPYVIGETGWEFSCTVPSDWVAQNLHESNNPKTIEDWKAALDATVIKKGVFTMVIHTWGWVKSEQVVELIDYAETKYGQRVKFLNFPEALERLEKNVTGGESLRAADGGPNGVRLIDLNQDGYLDVISGSRERELRTRIWDADKVAWREVRAPTAGEKVAVTKVGERAPDVRFGKIGAAGEVVMMGRTEDDSVAWRFDGTRWVDTPELWHGLELDGVLVQTSLAGRDQGVRLRDFDGDGQTELVLSRPHLSVIWAWQDAVAAWERVEYALPKGASIVDTAGGDNGLRWVDVNEDGFDDVIWSNPESWGLHLFVPEAFLRFEYGWTREVMQGAAGAEGAIPLIVRGGAAPDNGAWFHSGHMWVQNEDTAEMPDLVDRRSFRELMVGEQPPALELDEALASFKLRDGFGIELVASEPQVQDPVAFEWGEDGVLWVVEMRDYPLGMDDEGAPGGVIKRLLDEDDDGVYETAEVFLDGLSYPTGVMPWRDGVLISVAPEILFARDVDGDGRADETEVLFKGFIEGNQQHLLNGFEYGLDNWIYGANGDSGGIVRSHATGKDVDIRGDDFRFRPQEGAFEGVEGRTQFGRRRDDWGNWFGNNNPAWGWHYVIPNRYLARNPFLPVRSTKRALAQYENSTRVYYSSPLQQRFNDPHVVDHVTSANSPTPYRDDWFGDDFASSVFISEPVYNLIHREVLEPDGVSFSSRRADGEHTSEFLTSTDNWFRPTTMKVGPDGALYIADMYRFVIEHPEWIPEDSQKNLDLRLGSDRGRIYRVFPLDAPARPHETLAGLSGPQLAARMESPNGWVRDTVQRIIVENQDQQSAAALRRLVKESSQAKVRLQALATLDGLGVLDDDSLVLGLRDSDARVRREAVRMSEPKFRTVDISQVGGLRSAVAERVKDDDPAVRMQMAFSLGEWPGQSAAYLLALLADNDWEHEAIRTAILSSMPTHHENLLNIPRPPLALAEANREYGEKLALALVQSAMTVNREIAVKRPRFDYDEVVKPFVGIDNVTTDPERGRLLFSGLCAPCHRFDGVGNQVGPDLETLGDLSTPFLLSAILDPNAAWEDKYAEVSVVKRDGRGLTGVVVEENNNAITMRIIGGSEVVLLKTEIERMEIKGKSLMLDGFESALSAQAMADLIAYLQLGK